MIREKEDVVVVGASAAGLFAAYWLAREGVPVRVYDAQAKLRPDARTLIVTPAWLRLLDFDVGEAVLNQTDTFELISQGASACVPLREPDVILERASFLHLLVREVQDAGGEVILNHRFEAMRDRSSSPLLRFRNGHGPEEMEATTVIGADGVHSTVAEEVDRSDLERVAIRQARVELPSDLASDTVRCWFDRESTRFFYWLIPESDQTGAVGLIADTEAEANEALDRFMGAHDMEPIEYQEAWVPTYPWCSRPGAALGGGRVLLVGDAAGQVKVTTVGGVVTGMRGGAAAARSILRGTSYARELRPLHWELRSHALVRRMLDGFSDEDYDRLLELLNRRASRILSHYNRDELTRALWRLLPAQPQWLFLGARALIAQV